MNTLVLAPAADSLPGAPLVESADGDELALQEAGELTRVLAAMPMTDPAYGAWWSTEDGKWLYARIRARIGVPISATINRLYGAGHEPVDVANTAVTMLRQDFTHVYIRKAKDPWSYLSTMLKRELFNTVGTHFRAELGDGVVQAFHDPRLEGVSLAGAAAATWNHLAPLVAPAKRDPLRSAITYFSELGGARLSHLYTYATTDPELTGTGLCRSEILAIANAVLGGRPNNSQTSLIAAFLTNPDFNPTSSLMHRKALSKFSSRMSAAAPEELIA